MPVGVFKPGAYASATLAILPLIWEKPVKLWPVMAASPRHQGDDIQIH